MIKQITAGLVLGFVGLSANAALLSRAGGQAYYDTTTNLTWVADANLAKTSGYDANGQLNWSQALAWIAYLDTQNSGLGYLGVTSWRLPTVTDTVGPGCVVIAYNGTDCGYNVDLATGEMARMYYGTLGNTGFYDTSGSPTGCNAGPPFCLTNTGPFSNVRTDAYYWTGTTSATSSPDAWRFNFGTGAQTIASKSLGYYAWAVSSGDTLATPLPAAAWLFGGGLAALGVLRRRQAAA